MSTIRTATYDDIPAMQALIALSGIQLSAGFYTPEQAAAITREVFGVDTQLVDDATYFAVEQDGRLVACGGWSKRVTPFGGDQHKRGVDRLLDPATEAARIRAFFVHPDMARRGIGRRLLEHCATAARAAGFHQLELTATMPGVPLYEACGFEKREPVALNLSGVAVPLVRMVRAA
ncbi:GNAT family N-acetyltransferase [Massilia sp. TS11]|uniref:GNAT family N-acetyltransferase n=1 Tax=Massilia sp. TS11 TaxID=2908003 RepID=UPI001EDB8B51|nr:GNAT family N-acetyltransferase [Massilia sp. TS11]MCG2586239.1 GNAT family N-acetyltransferase [Massilia sp. TS11]